MTSIENRKIKGVVLVGGASSRMGTAKAYLTIGGQPFYRKAAHVLNEVCDQVYFSQSPKLHPPLPPAAGLFVNDIFREPFGPLSGMISAFKQLPNYPLFFLACDLPNFSKAAACQILHARDPHCEATAFVDRCGNPEPLCAIYEPRAFFKLVEAWALGIMCPKKILSSLNVKAITPEDPAYLANVNTRDEFEAIANSDTATTEVEIELFASLQEAVGEHKIHVTTAATTLEAVYVELKARYGFSYDVRSLNFARNHEIVNATTQIASGDVIAFIPPVSGG